MPKRDFVTIAAAIALAAHLAHADNRDVQISGIDLENGLIELTNFGVDDIALDGWRFCSHDFNQPRRYTAAAGFTGFTIEAGTTVFVHYNNDAPGGDPDRVNRSTLGGTFATPFGPDAWGMQIFFPNATGVVSFGDSTLIADHIQWNVDGGGVGSAETRTAQAVGQGLWTANGEFIETTANTLRIDLTDLSNGRNHGPSDYSVTNDTPIQCAFADITTDGACDTSAPDGLVTLSDFSCYLSEWSASSAFADITLTGACDVVAGGGDGVDLSDFSCYLSEWSLGCP